MAKNHSSRWRKIAKQFRSKNFFAAMLVSEEEIYNYLRRPETLLEDMDDFQVMSFLESNWTRLVTKAHLERARHRVDTVLKQILEED